MEETKETEEKQQKPIVVFTINETGQVDFMLQNIDLDHAYLAAFKGLIKLERAIKASV